jgi:hypothetical protein
MDSAMRESRLSAMKRVRHIACSWNGSRVAVAECDRRVAVWDILSAEKLSEFDTVLDFGGTRLAITADGERVIAGAYHRYGIACYHASTGALVWHRKDLKKVQHLALSPSGDRVYCGFEARAGRSLDVTTGDDAAKLHGVASVIQSPFSDQTFVEKKSGPAVVYSPAGRRIGRIQRTTFGFLSVAFGQDLLLTSESTGPVRCFALPSVQETWRLPPRLGSHALYVHFDEDAQLCQAIMWSYTEGGLYELLRLDPNTGVLRRRIHLSDSPVYGFCLRGTHLLTWDGSLVDVANGHIVRRLEFPSTSVY